MKISVTKFSQLKIRYTQFVTVSCLLHYIYGPRIRLFNPAKGSLELVYYCKRAHVVPSSLQPCILRQ
jgi:hypothetical protein